MHTPPNLPTEKLMAYRHGNREQANLLPSCIEEYVGPEDPVRAYDAFIDALNFKELDIKLDECKVGNSEYYPKTMLKLLVYGYSYGVQSSRKLERATHHNLSFIWLMGGKKPDFKTISNFRKKNKTALRKVLKQCVRMCINLDLIDGNILFIDGSKFRGNASINAFYTKERAEKSIAKINERIDALLEECDEMDTQESSQPSLVKLKKELKSNENLKNKIQDLLADLGSDDKRNHSINLTDREVNIMHGRQGSHAGVNVQIATDEKHGLIVNNDVTNENNDLRQFSSQVKQANNNLEEDCKTAVADSGFSKTSELKEVHEEGIEVIVPSQKQALKKTPKKFSKEEFTYDKERDIYVCPENHVLTYRTTQDNYQKYYHIEDKQNCLSCAHFGECTKSKDGRRVTRLVDEEWKEHFEKEYEKPESRKIYSKRKEKVELPFGHFKRNLGISSFLLRGMKGAKAEMSVLSTCFNLTRMITILGVPALIRAFQG